LPIPAVTWRARQWDCAFGLCVGITRGLAARRALRGAEPHGQALSLQLVLAARPFQVNPPAQSLNNLGGVSPIRDIAWDGASLAVNGSRRVFPLRAPDRVGAFSFDAGPLSIRLTGRAWSGPPVHDDAGYASAALAYQLTLAPYASSTWAWSSRDGRAGAAGRGRPCRRPRGSPARSRRRHAWRERLTRVSIDVPASGRPCDRRAPHGARASPDHARRSGAAAGDPILRTLVDPRRCHDRGVAAAPGPRDRRADYLRWYAPYQFASGKVPCCIDERGADPVAENDSPGELIFLASEVYRYTGDRALLDAMWPHVAEAARYLETLRAIGAHRGQSDARHPRVLRAAARVDQPRGYAAKPVHSYWDDFWG